LMTSSIFKINAIAAAAARGGDSLSVSPETVAGWNRRRCVAAMV
jgi:hypothetical protein